MGQRVSSAPQHRIPARIVQLGTVLDCVIEHAVDREWRLLTVTEWKGWLVCANEACMGQAPGRARLILLPKRDVKKKRRPAVRSELYNRWHKREPSEVVLDLEVPDSIAHVQGRCVRIGYRSDKWARRGASVDYEHDFRERGGAPPLLYTDSPALDHARAALLIGGSMRITEAGID